MRVTVLNDLYITTRDGKGDWRSNMEEEFTPNAERKDQLFTFFNNVKRLAIIADHVLDMAFNDGSNVQVTDYKLISASQ